jgi:hypothetical protein
LEQADGRFFVVQFAADRRLRNDLLAAMRKAEARKLRAAARLKRPAEPAEPRPRNELFDAVVEVTGFDPKVNGALIGKTVAVLNAADPPYTPAEVRMLKSVLDANRLDIPMTIGVIEKYIGWTRNKEKLHGRPAFSGGGMGQNRSRVVSPPGKYDRFNKVVNIDDEVGAEEGAGGPVSSDAGTFG